MSPTTLPKPATPSLDDSVEPVRAPAQRPARSATVLTLQAHALAHARFDAAAAAVLNQLVVLLGCERASLGLGDASGVRVAAISGAVDVEGRRGAVAGLASAMNEAVEQGSAIVFPLPHGASPAITRAHRELAQGDGRVAICTLPIATRDEVMGALLFERRAGFDAETFKLAQDVALFVGPLLVLKQRADARIAQRFARAVGIEPQRPNEGAAFPVGRTLVAGLLAAAAALLAWPSTYRVVAPARLEGEVQQIVAAPVDGFVASVAVRPGEAVKTGQVLLTLDNREMTLERDRWAAEAAQLDKQYREALSHDDATPIVIARTKLEQAQSQYALVAQMLERATVRAPMDGIVLTGDLSQQIGAPLKRGAQLMAIAPDRGWRVVAEVDEQEIAALREGQHAQVLFAALGGGEPLRFAVTRIAPVATQSEGHNVFEVEGAPQSQGEGLRPGMRGVARIEVGERALGAVWWERARHAWQRFAWRLLG